MAQQPSGAVARSAPAASLGTEFFPFMLMRRPLLPATNVISSPFEACLPYHSALEEAEAKLTLAFTSAKSAFAVSPDPVGRAAAFAFRAIRRALAMGRIPAEDDARMLDSRRYGRLREALSQVAAAAAEHCAAEAAWQTALAEAAAADDARLIAHLADPTFAAALALTNPEILNAGKHSFRLASSKRARSRLLRTLRRLVWRASGRPTPFGLLGATGVVPLDPSLRGETLAAAPAIRLTCRVRPPVAIALLAASGEVPPDLPTDPTALEVATWSRAGATQAALVCRTHRQHAP